MKDRKRLLTVIVALVASLSLVAAACGTDDEAGADRPSIVVTTTIWGDVVEQIVGGDADVEVLMPVGADPHSFEPSSRQATLIQQADLVVANGLGLEEGLHDLLDAAAADGVNVFEVAPLLTPIPFADDDGHEGDDDHADEGRDEEGDHDDDAHGGDDPHVWMDPDRVALAAALISDELLEIVPDGPWKERADDYVSLLMSLDSELAEDFDSLSVEGRKMVTNHHSLGYLALRYDFEVIGVVIPGGSTLGDPSSQELAELVHAMEEENARTIYTETTEPSALADSVAAELGDDVTVVELYTGSIGEAANGTDSYIGMMRENAKRIVEANT